MKKVVGLIITYLIILLVYVDFKLSEIESNDFIYSMLIWCILCLSVLAFYGIDKYITIQSFNICKSTIYRVMGFVVVTALLTGMFYFFELNQKISIAWFYYYPISYLVVSIFKLLNSVSSKFK